MSTAEKHLESHDKPNFSLDPVVKGSVFGKVEKHEQCNDSPVTTDEDSSVPMKMKMKMKMKRQHPHSTK